MKAAAGGFRRDEHATDVVVNVSGKHAAECLDLETRAEWKHHRIDVQWVHGRHGHEPNQLSSSAIFAAVCRELDAWKGNDGIIYSEKSALVTGHMPPDKQRGDIELDILSPEVLFFARSRERTKPCGRGIRNQCALTEILFTPNPAWDHTLI